MGYPRVRELRRVMEKDRELFARIALDSPRVAGAVLKLCDELESAHRNGELPPTETLTEFGRYLESLGRLLTALARPTSNTVVVPLPAGLAIEHAAIGDRVGHFD